MSLILVVTNVSPEGAEFCDYVWRAQINHEIIEKGKVTAHYRADGWMALVRRIVEEREA